MTETIKKQEIKILRVSFEIQVEMEKNIGKYEEISFILREISEGR